MATEAKITEEQATDALRALVAQENGDQGEPVPAEEPAAPAEAPAEETPAAPAEEPATEEAAPVGEAPSDDVASLKARLTEAQREADERVAAMQQRFTENQRIVHERFLRKATVADRAHKILKQSRTDQGVAQEEVDRVIAELEGSMNPNSPSYAPPPQQNAGTEDQAIVMNNFLNEKRMTLAEADTFGNWLRTEGQSKLSPAEQQVAGRDLDGFLRIAHSRFSEQQNGTKKRDDAVEAARSIQRTQREAARAASTTAAAPRKQPVARPAGIDLKKLTRSDISRLVKESVEAEYGR